MATRPETVEFILEQISDAGDVSARKMFGEYGVYANGKFIAVICDDLFHVKPTDAGAAFAPDLEMGSPYPGAKPHLIVQGDQMEDRDWATQLVRITVDALPAPKPKKSKREAPATRAG